MPSAGDIFYFPEDPAKWADSDLTTVQGALDSPLNRIDLKEIAVPSAPAADHLRLFARDYKGFSFPNIIDNGGMNRALLRDSVFVAKNDTGVEIAQNRVVYASGSSDDVPTIALARSNAAATMPAIGVTIESIADGAYGRVMQVGLLENIDTSGLAVGNIMYVHSAVAGLVQVAAPVYPNIRQEIGTVLVADAAAGAIQVVARSAFNDAVIDHGGLLGLADDDHTQYLLVAGSRAMSGALDMGTNAITNVGNIDGRDVSVDGTKLDGIEPLADVTDEENVEAAGAVMDGDFGENGLMSSIAGGSYAARTIAAGSAKLTVTNGDGVAGHPTIDLGSVAHSDLSDTQFTERYFSAYRTSNQAANSGAYTVLICDSEHDDDQGWYDTATGKFQPDEAGWYLVGCTIALGTLAADKKMQVLIYHDGSVERMADYKTSSISSNMAGSGAAIVYCDGDTDYITFVVYHNHGASRNIIPGTNNAFTHCWGLRID
jgi:hypothetical protein